MASRPIVLVTGAAGNIGTALHHVLRRDYAVVGMDREGAEADFPLIAVDLGSDAAVDKAFAEFRERFGGKIASVIHLAAYFDFTGEENPLYQTVNVKGTRRLLRALQEFEVEQFLYSSTILVHAPTKPGGTIDEASPIGPRWAYPKSKAAAEDVIRLEHGKIPYVLLRLAGVYDARTAVPTLAEQVARIYERELQSHLYSGDTAVGQAMLHKADMVRAFKLAVDRRADLAPDAVLLVGEAEVMSYAEIQDAAGRLIHGEAEWTTLSVPKPLAKAGAWAQARLEPVVPDAIDQGEKPFIRPFMVDMADDHYALDTRRAKAALGWTPRHGLRRELPRLIAALKADPAGWYAANKVLPPPWMASAKEAGANPEAARATYRRRRLREHRRYRWTHMANMAFGAWLAASPPALDTGPPALAASSVVSGALILVLASLCLSERQGWARWACAAVGTWVMAAPFLFWSFDAGAYLEGTLVCGLVFALAIGAPPEPGPSPAAAATGPVTPPGWDYNPSSWSQRLPIIALALAGLLFSRYLAAYQLGHTGGVWEPFFAGGPDPKNGTEEIITSDLSEAWPVSDAAVGAFTYMLEILTGIVGSQRRWRTMPWLVLLFGLMIAPLGIVSITFIVIQPIVIGTWCTLCLAGAAAMLVQVPYSLDELLATVQFLIRRKRAGHSLIRVLLVGDTDEGGTARAPRDEFARPLAPILKDMAAGGVNLPWTLALCGLIGAFLMLTRVFLDASGRMADCDHLIGALVLTATAIACAEVARPARFLNIAFGAALLVSPFVFETDAVGLAARVVLGLALVALSFRRGPVRRAYGGWNRLIV